MAFQTPTNSIPARLLGFTDQLSPFAGEIEKTIKAVWGNRLLLLGILLFTISLPHSIAAADISLGIAVAGWVWRDIAMRRFHAARTPLDWPLLCLAVWTILSSILSVEPGISLPKTRSLVVFAVFYLLATNVTRRAADIFLGFLIASALTGAVFSLGEKVIGRGATITAIDPKGPLGGSRFAVGDCIWLINKTRVSSMDDVNRVMEGVPEGATAGIEALHNGDPIPFEITVTPQMKRASNPLGVELDGRSRRFRASGFSRHFLTYAEQMQLLSLLVCGALLARRARKSPVVTGGLFPVGAEVLIAAIFAAALLLTASRAVIASFLLALLLVMCLVMTRKAALIAVLGIAVIGGMAGYVVISTRATETVSFSDDSTTRRLSYMKAGLRVIPGHPVFGVGMDSHKKHWAEWGFPGDYVTHTHSTPIQLAMDRGIPALGFYLWLIVAMAVATWRSFVTRQDWLGLGGLAAVAGFFLSSLSNYNFGDSEVLMLLLFIVGLVFTKPQPGQYAD